MLAMALVGYEIEKTKIEEKIRQIRAQIGVGGVSGKGKHSSGVADEASIGGQPKRRKFSAAARKRMAAAQRKRWAEKRSEKSAS